MQVKTLIDTLRHEAESADASYAAQVHPDLLTEAADKLEAQARVIQNMQEKINELTNRRPTVHTLSTDDWEGIYINGNLVSGNHGHRGWQVLNLLDDAGIITITSEERSMEWFEQRGGSCPVTQAEITPDGE